MDPQGNHIGYIAEQEMGMRNVMARQLFRTHRSFITHVFDKNEVEVLRVSLSVNYGTLTSSRTFERLIYHRSIDHSPGSHLAYECMMPWDQISHRTQLQTAARSLFPSQTREKSINHRCNYLSLRYLRCE